MIPCKTHLCPGKIKALESWRQGTYAEHATAGCSKCGAAYWLVKRDKEIFAKDRKLSDFDQRKVDR